MDKRNFRLPVIRIYAFLSFLPFYIGSAYIESEWLSMIINYGAIFLGGISFFAILLMKYRTAFSRIIALLLIMYLYIFCVTVRNDADVMGLIRQILPMFYILFVFAMFRDNIDDIFIPLQWFLGLLIISNIISLIVYPEGLGTVIVPEGGYSTLYFLGHDNSHILYLLPCFIISQYRIIKNYDRRLGVCIISRAFQIAAIVNIIITRVGASVVWMLIIIVVYNIFKVKTLNRAEVMAIFIAIPVALNIVVVFMQRQIQWVTMFAQNLLGKSSTFSGRVYAWNTSLKVIFQKPITGQGYYSNALMPELIGYQQAHNLVLQLMLIGGVILVALYVYILISLFRRIEYAPNDIKALGRAALVSYLIYAVAESQLNYKMLIFIPILWYMVNCEESHVAKVKVVFGKKS